MKKAKNTYIKYKNAYTCMHSFIYCIHNGYNKLTTSQIMIYLFTNTNTLVKQLHNTHITASISYMYIRMYVVCGIKAKTCL